MAETLSISERVFAALLCRLGEIRKADGFRTDAGLRVRNSQSVVDEKNAPTVVLWETSEEVQDGTGGGRDDSMKLTLSYSVEAHAKANQADTGEVLQLLKADVKRALLRNRGGIAGTDGKNFAVIAYEGATAAPREAGASTEFVSLRFRVNFPEAYGDPYAAR